ncbi:hypothetical protein ACWOBE_04270 [Hutsoniella sourekii]
MQSYQSSNQRLRRMTITALLTALAILIPIIMPVKIVVGPASYTLASHVPVVMAMFVSPQVAFFVALGSGLGFFIAGFPIVIVARAVSHVIFATIGSNYIMKRPQVLQSTKQRCLYSVWVNILHSLAEVIVVLMITQGTANGYNYFYFLLVLVGVGSFLHGLMDFEIAYQLTKALNQRVKTPLSTIDI